MGPLDALWHLFNFLLPAFGVGALAATLCKLLWWRTLRAVAWHVLAAPAVLGGVAVLVLGLLVTGRDGRMATYALLVGVNAAVLWWVAFGRRRGSGAAGS